MFTFSADCKPWLNSCDDRWTIPAPRPRPALLILVIVLLSSAATEAAPLDFAHGLFREKRYAMAVDEYERALGQNLPEETAREATFYLAESFVQLAKGDQALPLYEKLAADPATRELFRRTALFRAAQIAQRSGQYAASLKWSRQFVDQFPNDALVAYAWNMVGEASLMSGQLPEAEKAYATAAAELAKSTAPADPNLRATVDYGKARVAERQGQIEQARTLFQQIAAQRENAFADDARLALGVIAFQEKQFEAAESLFKELRREFPDSPLLPLACLNQALALEQLGRHDEASQLLHEALGSYANSEHAADIAYQAARAEYQAGRYRTAMDELVRWATNHKEDTRADQAWYSALRAAMECREMAAAIGIYEKLTSAHANSPYRDRAAAALAEGLANATNVENRIQVLDRLVQETDAAEEAQRVRYYAAATRFATEDYAAAIAVLQPLLQSSTDAAVRRDASYLLGVSLVKSGDESGAIAPLEQYLKAAVAAVKENSQYPKSIETAIRYLGDALSQTDPTPDHQRAMETMIHTAKQLPSGGELLRSLATQQSARDRHGAADAIYAQLAALELPAEERAKVLIDWGWTLLRLEKAEVALAKFSEAASVEGATRQEQAEALYLAGTTAQKLGKTAEAVAALGALVKDHQDAEQLADGGLRLAEIYAADQKLEQADGIYATLAGTLADSPKLDRVLYERGWLALDRDDQVAADKYFTELSQRLPASPLAGDATLKLAELAYSRGDYQKSFDDTVNLAGRNPDPSLQVPLYYRQGLAAQKLGKTADAKAAFEKLTRDFPSDRLTAVARFWLGELEFEAGDFPAAVSQFEAVLNSPDAERYHPTAQLRLAECYFGQKEWNRAIETAETLGRGANPALAREAQYVQGRALAQQAKFDEAREKFAAVIGDDRSEISAKARFMTAETFLHQRRYTDALRDYLQVKILYRLPEWQAMALLQAGKCHEELTETEKAIQAYQQLLDEFPSTTSAPAAKERLNTMQTRQNKP